MPRLLVLLGTAALVALVAVRLTGTERGPLLALLVGALPLVLLAAWPLLVAAVWLRSVGPAVACTGLVAAQVLLVAPSLTAAPLPEGAAGAARLRVVVANLYVGNPEPRRVGEVLRGLDADVVVVPELDARGLHGLEQAGLIDDLPHRVAEGDGTESVGLLSRLPLHDVALRRAGARVVPQATVDVGGVPVRLLAAHPLPPVGGLEPLWRAGLADLAGEVRDEQLPTVVAGDLNAGRHHELFRDLLDAGLRDAHDERGRGLARTWPAALPLLHLDHVLVRDGDRGRLAVLDVREVDLPGSDHLAVVADVAVLPQGQ